MRKSKPKGLGDTIDQITTATGIKSVVKFIAGDDCGCEERKEKLNKLFPYTKPNCLSEHDYNFLTEFFNRPNKSTVIPSDQFRLNQIYTSVFNKPAEFTSCSSCLLDRINELKKIFEIYVIVEQEQNEGFDDYEIVEDKLIDNV